MSDYKSPCRNHAIAVPSTYSTGVKGMAMRNAKPAVMQIFPHFEGWAVKYHNAEEICGAFGTSQEALQFITEQANGVPVKLMIYDIYGKLRQRMLMPEAQSTSSRVRSAA